MAAALFAGYGTAALAAGEPAPGATLAEDDITLAAIASGRLYVRGTTSRPHQPVVLDGRFETESDEAGTFQYELVYHPASCIVGARIAASVHEAVVGNCGQQGPKGDAADARREAPPREPAPVAALAPPPTAMMPDPPSAPATRVLARAPLPPQRPSARALLVASHAKGDPAKRPASDKPRTPRANSGDAESR